MRLKKWLKKKRLAFEQIDIIESDSARDEIIEKSSQLAVPVIDVDGVVIVGFNEKKLTEVIKKAKS